MNIKDLPQGSYQIVGGNNSTTTPPKMNIKDLPAGSYKVVTPPQDTSYQAEKRLFTDTIADTSKRISNIGNEISRENNPISKFLAVGGNVGGIVGDTIGNLDQYISGGKVGEAIGKTVGTATTGIIDGLGGKGTTQDIGQYLSKKAQEYPERAEDIKNIAEFSNLALLSSPVRKIAKEVVASPAMVTRDIAPAVKNVAGATAKAVLPKAKSIEDIAGKIAQGDIEAQKSLISVLPNINTKGIRTYDSLVKTVENKIPELAKVVDDTLAKDATAYPVNTFTKTVLTDSGEKISTNYIDNALANLAELYQSTGDIRNLANIKNKVVKGNFTKKEINDIAKEYGQEFGSKAFNKMGDPLTSVNAVRFENTRQGLKNLAREGMGETAKNADRLMSDIYDSLKYLKKNAEGVNKFNQQLRERGVLEKVGGGIANVIDISTGRAVSGALKRLLPNNMSDIKGNYLDFEKQLPKLLNQFYKANKGKGKFEITSEYTPKPRLALPAPKQNTGYGAINAKSVEVPMRMPEKARDLNFERPAQQIVSNKLRPIDQTIKKTQPLEYPKTIGEISQANKQAKFERLNNKLDKLIKENLPIEDIKQIQNKIDKYNKNPSNKNLIDLENLINSKQIKNQ